MQSFAQEKKIDGKITNDKNVEGIHILNTSSRFNSVTNKQGNFFITVKPLDTLVISSIVHVPKQVVVTQEIYDVSYIEITLEDLINELDEVYLGPRLSGNLEQDLKSIKTKDPINFDDVGIPGFKGKPEEKIVPAYSFKAPLAVSVEAIYKHLSGYYRKLKIQRKWESQNIFVAQISNYYSRSFFEEAFLIPDDRLYDFLLFCTETSSIQKDFENENFAIILHLLEAKSKEYLNATKK